MGKIRTRTLGNEEEEKKQKQEQKQKAAEKKAIKADKAEKSSKKKSKAVEALIAVEQKENLNEEGEANVQPKKEVRKESKKAEVKVPSHVRGKKYQAAVKKIDKSKIYSLPEAISNLKKITYAKFDEAVELHFNTDETGLKGEVELPHATGKTVRVKIVDDALLDQIEQGKIEFDVLIAHPSYMVKLAKFAKVLGPKGLMPNPKAGTVSPTPEQVAKKFEKGTLRWKTEAKFPLLHQMIGKVSADEKNLTENAEVFIKSVGKNHIKSAYIKTTMSPSLKLNIENLS